MVRDLSNRGMSLAQLNAAKVVEAQKKQRAQQAALQKLAEAAVLQKPAVQSGSAAVPTTKTASEAKQVLQDIVSVIKTGTNAAKPSTSTPSTVNKVTVPGRTDRSASAAPAVGDTVIRNGKSYIWGGNASQRAVIKAAAAAEAAAKAAAASSLSASSANTTLIGGDTGSSTYYEVDSALESIYQQATAFGISIAKPGSYGSSITDAAKAQAIIDAYTEKANNAISAKVSEDTVYDTSSQFQEVYATAKGYGVTVAMPATTQYKTAAAAQAALDSYVEKVNTALANAPAPTYTNIDPQKTSGYAYTVGLSHAQQNELIRRNQTRKQQGKAELSEFEFRQANGISTETTAGSYVKPKLTNKSIKSTGSGTVTAVKDTGPNYSRAASVGSGDLKISAIKASAKTISPNNKTVSVISAADTQKQKQAAVAAKKADAAKAAAEAVKAAQAKKEAEAELAAKQRALVKAQAAAKKTANASVKSELQQQAKTIQKDVNTSKTQVKAATEAANATAKYANAVGENAHYAEIAVNTGSASAAQKASTALKTVKSTKVKAEKAVEKAEAAGVTDHTGQILVTNGSQVSWISSDIERVGGRSGAGESKVKLIDKATTQKMKEEAAAKNKASPWSFGQDKYVTGLSSVTAATTTPQIGLTPKEVFVPFAQEKAVLNQAGKGAKYFVDAVTDTFHIDDALDLITKTYSVKPGSQAEITKAQLQAAKVTLKDAFTVKPGSAAARVQEQLKNADKNSVKNTVNLIGSDAKHVVKTMGEFAHIDDLIELYTPKEGSQYKITEKQISEGIDSAKNLFTIKPGSEAARIRDTDLSWSNAVATAKLLKADAAWAVDTNPLKNVNIVKPGSEADRISTSIKNLNSASVKNTVNLIGSDAKHVVKTMGEFAHIDDLIELYTPKEGSQYKITEKQISEGIDSAKNLFTIKPGSEAARVQRDLNNFDLRETVTPIKEVFALKPGSRGDFAIKNFKNLTWEDTKKFATQGTDYFTDSFVDVMQIDKLIEVAKIKEGSRGDFALENLSNTAQKVKDVFTPKPGTAAYRLINYDSDIPESVQYYAKKVNPFDDVKTVDSISKKLINGQELTESENQMLTYMNGGYTPSTRVTEWQAVVKEAETWVSGALGVLLPKTLMDNSIYQSARAGIVEDVPASAAAILAGGAQALGYTGYTLKKDGLGAYGKIGDYAVLTVDNMARGTVKAFEDDPVRFLASAVAMEGIFRGIGVAARPIKQAAVTTGKATGVVKTSALKASPIPYREYAAVLRDFFDDSTKTIRGTHATVYIDKVGKPVHIAAPGTGAYIEPRMPGNTKVRFATMSSGATDVYGGYFLTKTLPNTFGKVLKYTDKAIDDALSGSKVYASVKNKGLKVKNVTVKQIDTYTELGNAARALNKVSESSVAQTVKSKAASSATGVYNRITQKHPWNINKRVYNYEIQKVPLTAEFKSKVLAEREATGGKFVNTHKEWKAQAQKLADESGEPVAMPSPKQAHGNWEAENEMVIIYPKNKNVISQKRTVGLTESGVPVQEIRFEGQKALPGKNVLEQLKENAAYNRQLALSEDYHIYNKNVFEMYVKDINTRLDELFGYDPLTRPGAYEGGVHGIGHTSSVVNYLQSQAAKTGKSPEFNYWLGHMHDMAKIGAHENAGMTHALSVAEAIRKGKITNSSFNSFYNKLSKFEQKEFRTAIAQHTTAKPLNHYLVTEWNLKEVLHPIRSVEERINILSEGVKTKLRGQSEVSKALANADRLDLTRFGATPKKRMMWNDLLDDASKKQLKQRSAKKTSLTDEASRKSEALRKQKEMMDADTTVKYAKTYDSYIKTYSSLSYGKYNTRGIKQTPNQYSLKNKSYKKPEATSKIRYASQKDVTRYKGNTGTTSVKVYQGIKGYKGAYVKSPKYTSGKYSSDKYTVAKYTADKYTAPYVPVEKYVPPYAGIKKPYPKYPPTDEYSPVVKYTPTYVPDKYTPYPVVNYPPYGGTPYPVDPSGGYGGAGTALYGGGQSYIKRAAITEKVVKRKKKPSEGTRTKKSKDKANIKRRIQNKLGSLDSMFGGSVRKPAKPAAKKPAAKKPVKAVMKKPTAKNRQTVKRMRRA